MPIGSCEVRSPRLRDRSENQQLYGGVFTEHLRTRGTILHGAGGKMMQNLEQRIRERAYELWLDGGCHHGNAEVHWLAAQRQVLSEALGAIGRVIPEKSNDHRTAKHRNAKRSALKIVAG